jgi:hypothetical protein
MSNLFNAVNTGMSLTDNGCVTNTSTLDYCLDLFFTIGASRGKDISYQFAKAFAQDKRLATQILFHARDIRGGMGERKLFRDNLLSITTKKNAIEVMLKTIEVGRFDDLHVFLGSKFEDLAVSIIADALVQGSSLAAKWTPRSGPMFNLLRKKMSLDPKSLRKMLVQLSNTVEQKMSAKHWSEIDYSKLPSLASARYMTAFHRNDPARYQAYKDALTKGEVKINAAAVYPYDVIKAARYSSENVDVSEAQWKALPDYIGNNDANILPVIDVSGSMDCPAGGSKNLTCMDVAVSLGMYVAERSKGIFKDQFITFHEKPQMVKMNGSFTQRLNQVYRAPWGGSTNLEATFRLIADAAVKHGLKQEDLPTQLLIFSDMQFNRIGGYRGNNQTAFQFAEKYFNERGYKLPQVVFWNLNAGNDNFPVQKDQTGALLVSGFSPSLMKSVLRGTEYNPRQLMLESVDKERYTINKF